MIEKLILILCCFMIACICAVLLLKVVNLIRLMIYEHFLPKRSYRAHREIEESEKKLGRKLTKSEIYEICRKHKIHIKFTVLKED